MLGKSISPDVRGELDRGVSDTFLEDMGHDLTADSGHIEMYAEMLEQELGRLVATLNSSERELTPEEERNVDMGWTTPASRRARYN